MMQFDKFEIGKESSLSNWNFQTRDLKNQVEMDRGIGTFINAVQPTQNSNSMIFKDLP